MTRPVLIVYALLAMLFSVWATYDDFHGRLSLSALAPLIAWCNEVGEKEISSITSILWGAAIAISVALLGFVVSACKHRQFSVAAIAASAAIALFGELLAIEYYRQAASFSPWLYVVVAIVGVLLLVAILARDKGQAPTAPQSSEEFTSRDFALLIFAMVIAMVFRYYALNQLLNYFEGELSPYMAGARTLHGIALANVGYNGPWAPLGYFFYLPIYFSTLLFGDTILAVRIGSALVSAASIPLIYIVLFKLYGRLTAIAAAFFMVFDPLQIGWGRSDLHPHGATLWIPLLIVLATAHFFKRNSWRSLAVLILLMGLCFHQYPSGQFAIGIPFIQFGFLLLFNWSEARKVFVKSLLLPLGVVLWGLGWPLQYVIAEGRFYVPDWYSIFGARTSWSPDAPGEARIDGGFLSILWNNVQDLFSGMYLHPSQHHFQDLIPDIGVLPIRTIPWFIAVWGMLAVLLILFKRSWRDGLILISWAIAGAFPCLMSAAAFAKRAAIFWPALMALTAFLIWKLVSASDAMGGRWFKRSVYSLGALACLAYIPIGSSLWFSGKQYRYGIPEAIAYAEMIRSYVAPGTILIVDNYDQYMRGRVTYLLSDEFARSEQQPVALYFAQDGDNLPAIIQNPALVSKLVVQPSHWYYYWTEMRKVLPSLASAHWSRVVYVASDYSEGTEHHPQLKRIEEFKQGCPTAKIRNFMGENSRYRGVVLECLL